MNAIPSITTIVILSCIMIAILINSAFLALMAETVFDLTLLTMMGTLVMLFIMQCGGAYAAIRYGVDEVM